MRLALLWLQLSWLQMLPLLLFFLTGCAICCPCTLPLQRTAVRLLRRRLGLRALWRCGGLSAWRPTTAPPSGWWRCWTTSGGCAWQTTRCCRQQLAQARERQARRQRVSAAAEVVVPLWWNLVNAPLDQQHCWGGLQ